MKQLMMMLLLASTLLLSTSCSDDGEVKTPPPSPKTDTFLTGTVVDPAGAPLQGVTVFTGTNETTTDEKGNFSLGFTESKTVSITADLSNYTQNSRMVALTKSQTHKVNIVLAPVDKVAYFDASSGVSVKVKGATVDLPADGFVDEEGKPFTGEVTAKVSYNRVTTPTGEALFPGDFIGLEDNGSTTGIISYGYIEVTLTDDSGNPLNLAPGEMAELTYPADPNIVIHPATIPLWYYDTEKGIWVEDGVATYDAATESYTGSVTHFTTWNLDAKFDGASVEGCVEDASGVRLNIADLYISTDGWNKHVTNNDTNGTFKFINAPSNKEMHLMAKLNDKASLQTSFTLLPGETKTLENCLQVDLNASDLFSQIKGKIELNDGTAFANKYVDVYDQKNTYLFYVRTDENGSFLSSDFLRLQNPHIKLAIDLYAGGQYTKIKKDFLISTTQKLSDLGTIVLNLTQINGCVEKSDGNTSFDVTGEVSIDTPYLSNRLYFDNNGLFELYVEQDYREHTLYSYVENNNIISDNLPAKAPAFVNNFSLLGKSTFTADRDEIDMNGRCLVLTEPVEINKSVSITMTTTREDAYLSVIYDTYANYEYPNTYGDYIFDGEDGERTATFNLTQNGIYYIFQEITDYDNEDYDGTFTLTVDGVSHTLTIPEGATAYDGWAAFAIEVFQGEIKVIELNIETGCEC